MNLLSHRIADIIFNEGARFSVSAEEGGLERVEAALEQVLREKGFDPNTIHVQEYRKFYHDGWNQLLDLVVPLDTRTRVTDRFYKLVFA